VAAAGAAPTQALANGFYPIVRESSTPAGAGAAKRPLVTLLYDHKYSEADKDTPPVYVSIDSSDFVPLILAEPPESEKDGRGFTLLRVRLAPEQEKKLEEFSRAHLNGKVCIVIGGDIVTMHKVRAVITGGKVQVTRCTDDACQVLKLKLTN
jgi:hypothetical protein